MNNTNQHGDERSNQKLLSMYCCAYNELASGVLIFDLSYHIVFANKQIFDYLGVDKLYGDDYAGLYSSLNKDIPGVLNKILESQMPSEGLTIKLRSGEHSSKWLLVHGKTFEINNSIYILLSAMDISACKNKEQILLSELELDLSTRTLNKYSLLKSISRQVSSTEQMPFTLCMLDFDGFKDINDNHGHLMGDEVLKIFAHISKKNIRTSDIIGRYGGEEFVFLFPNVEVEQAAEIIIRIQHEVNEHFSSILPLVSFSAGLLYIDPLTASDLDSSSIINQADKLLYEAKARGKNQIVTPAGDYLF